MPIYAYKCESCGHAKDVLQKMSDTPLVDCPACGAATFKKQLTAAGFQLKGSGWYATDFKGGGAAPAADKSEKAESGSGTGSGTAGDSKSNESNSGPKTDSKTDKKTDSRGDTKSESKSESKSEPKGDSKTVAPAASKPVESASGKTPAA